MEERFITGIHNYCDRWCERCTFTARCAIYEKNGELSPDQKDSNNKAFWEEISKSLQETIALLLKDAESRGINLNELLGSAMNDDNNERSSLRETARNEPVAKLCSAYQKLVMPFVKKSEGFVDKTRALVSELHMGLKSPEDVIYSVAGISDCFEIIQWYLFFINGKIQRALLGKMRDDGWDDEHGFQKDYDGSAKIALIAIDKNMSAWIKLLELLPDCEDVALKALALLEKIKHLTMETFPEAMQFKRPGFDD